MHLKIILGPILCLLYINDLPNATSMLPFLFADDTTVVESGPDLPELRLWNTFSEHELKQVTSPNIFKERL